VQVETDLDVTGRPAQFGRGLMEEVASKMLGQFSGRLEKLVLDGPPADSSPSGAPGRGAKEAAADGGAAPRAASSAPFADDEGEVLDLGAAMLGGGATKLVAGGVGVGLLALLLSLLFRRRAKRGFSFSISYRA
jgi:hypothetical protein